MLNDKTIKILKALLVKKKVVKGTTGCTDRRCIIVISISIVSDTVAIWKNPSTTTVFDS